MPVKILLADKSITIQKVVEMLFTGKEYDVLCVSDGESALSEARRAAPDVVLADVDLPRIDGYSFAAQLKDDPALAKTPVILMLGRDDIYDAGRGKESGILDSIVKPFESQELIGKVNKALADAPPRPERAENAPTAAEPEPVPSVESAPEAEPAKPATDIFSIISEAPTQDEVAQAAPPDEGEAVYEVEPVVEDVEEPAGGEADKGQRADEGPWAGHALSEERPEEHAAPRFTPVEPPMLSDDELRKIAEEVMAKRAMELMKDMTLPIPKISEETVRRGIMDAVSVIARDVAREVIEKVAWEVVPDLAEHLIKAEIERLKAME